MVNLTREKNARAFLFGMLTLVVIFVSVVCVVINNRNDKIISGASIGETDNIEEAADNISIDDENIENNNDIDTNKEPATTEIKRPKLCSYFLTSKDAITPAIIIINILN